MKKLTSLSVFFPAYNDGQAIPILLAKTYAVLPKVAKKYEVIVVNDGSTDETASIISLLKKQYQDLKIIEHKKNRGYSGALQSGFRAACYEWVFYTDGDGQYDPEELEKLVAQVNDKVDVVNGYKISRN